MYHVTITNDKGDVVSESVGNALVLVHNQSVEDGIRVVRLMDDVLGRDVLNLVFGLDDAKGGLLDKDPMLKAAYALKDLFSGQPDQG